MKLDHYATAEIARSPQERWRNATLLFVSTLTIMSGATISASLPGIAARFADVDNVALLSRLVLTLPGAEAAVMARLTAALAGAAGAHPAQVDDLRPG